MIIRLRNNWQRILLRKSARFRASWCKPPYLRPRAALWNAGAGRCSLGGLRFLLLVMLRQSEQRSRSSASELQASLNPPSKSDSHPCKVRWFVRAVASRIAPGEAPVLHSRPSAFTVNWTDPARHDLGFRTSRAVVAGRTSLQGPFWLALRG